MHTIVSALNREYTATMPATIKALKADVRRDLNEFVDLFDYSKGYIGYLAKLTVAKSSVPYIGERSTKSPC